VGGGEAAEGRVEGAVAGHCGLRLRVRVVAGLAEEVAARGTQGPGVANQSATL
jgi:hypothetical protein